MESAYSDIAQRRLTAEEIIQNASPASFFVSLGLEQKRRLESKLEKARRSCVEQLVRFYSRNVRKEAVDSLFDNSRKSSAVKRFLMFLNCGLFVGAMRLGMGVVGLREAVRSGRLRG